MNKIELIKGDCLEKMKDIEDENIHCILTDIPYGINLDNWDVLHDNTNSALLGSSPAQEGKSGFKRRGKPKNGWSKKDKDIGIEFQEYYKNIFKEWLRILKPAGCIIAFTGRQWQHRFVIAGENANAVFKDTLCWDKKQAPFKAQRVGQVIGKRNGDFSDNRRLGNLAPIFEPIVWMFKPYKIGGTLTDCYLEYGTGTFDSTYISSNIISVSSKIKNRLHEAQKPPELIEILLRTFTKENQIVLDCYFGSNETGIACLNTNRSFIGIEKDEKYFDIGVNRVKENMKDDFELIIKHTKNSGK